MWKDCLLFTEIQTGRAENHSIEVMSNPTIDIEQELALARRIGSLRKAQSSELYDGSKTDPRPGEIILNIISPSVRPSIITFAKKVVFSVVADMIMSHPSWFFLYVLLLLMVMAWSRLWLAQRHRCPNCILLTSEFSVCELFNIYTKIL